MAVKLKSVYKLFHMSGDIVYALLFPQLTAAMYIPKHVNWFGSISAFVVGVLLRFLRFVITFQYFLFCVLLSTF